MKILPLPLETIFYDIKQCLDAKLYYPALLVSLTIPEICMSLALERDVFVKKKHYIEFLEKYQGDANIGMKPETCYQIRGGVVHRADLRGHHHVKYSHIIFTTPESKMIHHGIILADDRFNVSALTIDLVTFIKSMEFAARNWYSENQDNEKVREALKYTIRTFPNGVSPFISGAPLVASGEEIPGNPDPMLRV